MSSDLGLRPEDSVVLMPRGSQTEKLDQALCLRLSAAAPCLCLCAGALECLEVCRCVEISGVLCWHVWVELSVGR